MNRLITSAVVFFGVLLISCFVYQKEIKLRLAFPFYIKTIFISFLLVMLISIFNKNIKGNVILYFVLLLLVAVDMLTREESKAKEKIFDEIIFFCNNMITMLKGNNNVYYAINNCLDELSTPLKNDLKTILTKFDENNNVLKEALDGFNRKYNYSIVKQLSSIILQFQFEGKGSEKALRTFRDDIEQLEIAVKNNQKKRKILRWQYLGLSIGSILAMYYLCNVILFGVINSDVSSIMSIYIYVVFISLFLVDVYFNLNISKE